APHHRWRSPPPRCDPPSRLLRSGDRPRAACRGDRRGAPCPAGGRRALTRGRHLPAHRPQTNTKRRQIMGRPPFRRAAAVLAAALLVAACGDDDTATTTAEGTVADGAMG